MTRPAFEILTSRSVLSKPIVSNGDILWPWVISSEARQTVAAKTRAETLDIDLLDRVLEERSIRANKGSL